MENKDQNWNTLTPEEEYVIAKKGTETKQDENKWNTTPTRSGAGVVKKNKINPMP